TSAGTLVQSLPMPQQTVGNQSRIIASNSVSMGAMSLSPDGTQLVVPGYDVDIGNTSTSFGAPIVIGVVDGQGNIDTSTTVPSNSLNLYGAAIQGNDIWMSFSGSGQGVFHITKGGNSPNLITNQANGGPRFVEAINVFGNQLYVSGNT